MTDDKLAALARVGAALNAEGLTWALGGSMMLYFRGVARDAHDLDLMTTDGDFPRAAAALERLGEEIPKQLSPRFKTRRIRAYRVDGVDIDLMAGLVIVKDGADYDRSLLPADIDATADARGVSVPLHALAAWRESYRLMGRDEKVRMIDEWERKAE